MKKIVTFTKIKAIVFNKVMTKNKNKVTRYKNSSRKTKNFEKIYN